ncbi:DUF2971 domain-containing protein [Lentimicrobium sp. S6]|uniref:DUF2971 domain-containing protein n=1 Tax=Lentimicrobium sp. S6 TaxID=2735872 RepID=UPI001558050C|nr:DUF2971 domain-containing protein [Lentimicrobium sp. S6]NPD45119.1 DUF2971 domain-containing protein [Lentimicrobium sp. S6]
MDKDTQIFYNNGNELANKYFREVVNPLLPKAETAAIFNIGADTPNEITISPQLNNSYIEGSVYEYKRNTLKYIHYTNTESAKSIIRCAILRMYSLLSMNDPQELSYALLDSIPAKTDKTINDYKQNLFTLSMNEFQDEKEEVNTWLDYGDCGKGVGIVLSFDKTEQNSWHQHYLSKIKYKEKDLNGLRKLHARHTEFSNSIPIQVHGQVRNFLLPLAAFHKTKGFKKEKEVRLLVINKDAFVKNQKSQYDPIIVQKEGNEITKSYIEFLLNPPKKEAYKNRRPIPKVEKIILGPRIENHSVLKDELKELAIRGLGYEIEVETSKIDLSNISQ